MKRNNKIAGNFKPYCVSVPGFKTADDIVAPVMEKIKGRSHLPGSEPDLELLPGAKAGAVTLICSLPSQGKSAYLMNLALELQGKGRNVAIFLPDYTAEEFVARAITSKAGVDTHYMAFRHFQPDQWKRFSDGADKLKAGGGLYFSDETWMTAQIIEDRATDLARALRREGRELDAVLVDSLNFVKEDVDDLPALEVLYDMAGRLKTKVICSFGLKETGSIDNGYIQLADVRAAGISERFTSGIFTLHRPEYYDRTDPSLKNKASLDCLYPYPGGRKRELDLLFRHETFTFSVQGPIILHSKGGMGDVDD